MVFAFSPSYAHDILVHGPAAKHWPLSLCDPEGVIINNNYRPQSSTIPIVHNSTEQFETTDAAALFQRCKAFFLTTDLSDLTITCGDRKWKVYKLAMSANSTFFKKACTGESKVRNSRTLALQYVWLANAYAGGEGQQDQAEG